MNETRGYACEIVAWRFVTHLSRRECIDYLLFELPALSFEHAWPCDTETGLADTPTETDERRNDADANERSPLILRQSGEPRTPGTNTDPEYFNVSSLFVSGAEARDNHEFTASFDNLNALEVAAVSGAKKFLSQHVVQRIIDSIWRGDIVFWESLSLYSVKAATVYNKKRADPYSRLRVPRYLKAFEFLFFASFLGLYYVVLVQKKFHSLMPAEVLLYVWIASFAYNECKVPPDPDLLKPQDRLLSDIQLRSIKMPVKHSMQQTFGAFGI